MDAVHSQSATFDAQVVLHNLAHFLPAQAPLKDFIHHNTLHAFQDLKFHKALNTASKLFGYKGYLSISDYRRLYNQKTITETALNRAISQNIATQSAEEWKDVLLYLSPNENLVPRIGRLRSHWKSEYKVNLDKVTHPILFRVISNYLDQGIAKWDFPISENGLLSSIREIEEQSYTSFFAGKRAKALLKNKDLSLKELLEILVYKEEYFENYLFDLCFAHPGWSGMVAVLDASPKGLLDRRKVSFEDFIKIELLLEIDALDQKLGETWRPLALSVDQSPISFFEEIPNTELSMTYAIWQEAYEWSYYDTVLAGMCAVKIKEKTKIRPSFQAAFCIDDREISTRRHLEMMDKQCETFGTPGHFNIVTHFQPEHSAFHTQICPAPLSPAHLIREEETEQKKRRDLQFTNHDHSIWRSGIATATLGLWSGVKLFTNVFRPTFLESAVSSFNHMDPSGKLTMEFKGEITPEGLKVGFTLDEMATSMERMLKSIGLVDNFAPIMYLVGHGASSVNNTYYAGYDCGACSGRPGSVNARLASAMLNDSRVRVMLAERGIRIPEDTTFIGGLHDTTCDEIAYFDLEKISEDHLNQHKKNDLAFQLALDMNAKERSRRFALSTTHGPAKKIHKKVKLRSVSLFEPRPEYNHATNSLCLIGDRSGTKDLFLDGRAFLNSYDYKIDPNGEFLAGILGAAAPVCGGINLEYYFSRTDTERLGSGSKLPHNVMGLIGVANGSDGDLRPGLPFQMVEIHDPMRLLMIIEQFPEVVMKTLQGSPATLSWFREEWIHLIVQHPETRQLFRFSNGEFIKYTLMNSEVPVVENLERYLESSEDNLAVSLLKAN
jgi:hypothetical protein